MNTQVVNLTEAAINYMKKIVEAEKLTSEMGVRLGVVGGGCSGLSYKIEFSTQTEKDNVQEYEGFKVLIDPKSSIYLKGVEVDYKDGLNSKGIVFNNPQAKNTCGCGESFSV